MSEVRDRRERRRGFVDDLARKYELRGAWDARAYRYAPPDVDPAFPAVGGDCSTDRRPLERAEVGEVGAAYRRGYHAELERMALERHRPSTWARGRSVREERLSELARELAATEARS